MGNNIEYEDELDLKLICLAITKKWKPIVSVAIICAVIAIIYGIITSTSSSGQVIAGNEDALRKYEEEIKIYQDDIAGFEADIESYSQKVSRLEEENNSLEDDKQRIYEEKEALDKYRENSVILNIDPYNVVKQTRTYYVSNDYQIIPDMTYQNKDPIKDIVKAYVRYIKASNMDKNESLDIVPLSNKSLDNESSVYISLLNVYNNDNNIIIEALGEDEIRAEELMDGAVKALESVKKKIYTEVGEHEIVLIESNSYNTFDVNLKNAQEAYDRNIEDMLKTINDRQNSLNTLITTYNNNIHNARANIIKQSAAMDAVAKPSSETVTDNKVLPEDLIKTALIGLIIGLFLSAGYFAFRYVFSGTIKSNEEMEGRYGIRVIGSYKDTLSTSVSVATICSFLKDGKDIIIAGCVGREDCERFASELRKKVPDLNVYVAGDVSKDVIGVDILRKSDKAVIIEKVDRSLIKDISHEVDIIKGTGADIIGCIMG